MKIISKIILLFLFSASCVEASQEIDNLRKYIDNLMDESYQTLNSKTLSADDKSVEIKKLIASHLHLDWMAKYALGRQRRMLSEQKINEFSKVYSQFVIKAYSDLSSSYNGEKATLKNIKKIDDNVFIANLEILKPNGQPPIKIDYLIHAIKGDKKNPYRIGDIITEGISILNSQQAEFNSVISSKGIDALIDELRNRTEYSKQGHVIRYS